MHINEMPSRYPITPKAVFVVANTEIGVISVLDKEGRVYFEAKGLTPYETMAVAEAYGYHTYYGAAPWTEA